jgi:hypothetical protein
MKSIIRLCWGSLGWRQRNKIKKNLIGLEVWKKTTLMCLFVLEEKMLSINTYINVYILIGSMDTNNIYHQSLRRIHISMQIK